MCGIVGFTTPGQDPAAAKKIVQGMADLIRHRGPDGEGCYADGTAALGHRRLSVIDLAGGGPPVLNEDGTLVVVFNGEIYNYKTLRARLQQRGHTFATDSDTEVLLHGYEEWGRDLPCRLRGMFAFAVWDRTRSTLFCARDLFGIKPLCYYKKGETLLFASEIKAFLAHPAFEKRLNEARLPDWLSMEYLPDAETLFTGVYELPPAHTLTWQAGRVTLARYAAPRFRAKRGRSLRAWAREIGDAVAESADAHRIADVEVGCFLSGGVDSSLITCEMARRQPAVQCFSVGYAEEAYSELPAARAAAQALGVPLTETTVTADDFFAANRAIQWYLDEPMPNPAEVPLYFLCKAARQRVKVVLSGEGADELFGGYNIYRDPFTARWYDRLPPWLRAGLGAAASLLPPARGVNFLVRRGMSLEERYFGPTALFNEREKRRLLLFSEHPDRIPPLRRLLPAGEHLDPLRAGAAGNVVCAFQLLRIRAIPLWEDQAGDLPAVFFLHPRHTGQAFQRLHRRRVRQFTRPNGVLAVSIGIFPLARLDGGGNLLRIRLPVQSVISLIELHKPAQQRDEHERCRNRRPKDRAAVAVLAALGEMPRKARTAVQADHDLARSPFGIRRLRKRQDVLFRVYGDHDEPCRHHEDRDEQPPKRPPRQTARIRPGKAPGREAGFQGRLGGNRPLPNAAHTRAAHPRRTAGSQHHKTAARAAAARNTSPPPRRSPAAG